MPQLPLNVEGSKLENFGKVLHIRKEGLLLTKSSLGKEDCKDHNLLDLSETYHLIKMIQNKCIEHLEYYMTFSISTNNRAYVFA